jgi:glutamyl-tRNA synthetase
MHLGNAWTALLAWLDIRKLGGTMVLRMEDLDPDRCRAHFAEGLLEDLCWLGLDWDEGPDRPGDFSPYNQSERFDLYLAAFEEFVRQGLVYPCFCSRAQLRSAASVVSAPHAGEMEPVYSGRCAQFSPQEQSDVMAAKRQAAYRLRVGPAEIAFVDLLFGPQRQALQQSCGDFVIRRSDGVYAYQLAVVVDDAAMGITRILRGADLLASTPRQIYLWQLLGFQPPDFIHVPLLLGTDGSRLSKRQGSLAIAALRQAGVRPEQVIGHLAAWAGLVEQPEPLRPAELIDSFSLDRIPRTPVVVDDTFPLSI